MCATGMHVEVRGSHQGVSSSLPPSGTWGMNLALVTSTPMQPSYMARKPYISYTNLQNEKEGNTLKVTRM